MGNISRLLGERGINAAVHTVRWKADSQATPPQIGLISSVISPGVDRNGSDVVLIDAPALLLSADAERVALSETGFETVVGNTAALSLRRAWSNTKNMR